MSFSIPKNVPSFDNTQREYENVYWRSSGHTERNSHAGNGVGGPIGNYFVNKNLPMYKDKPYGYASSTRSIALYKRKRLWAGVLSIVAIVLLLDYFQSSTVPKIDWERRRESVKDAFKLSWDGYERYAWGNDEYYPISKTGQQMTPTGMGWIIVDALDTLMIMNLTSRLSHAREWISTSLSYDQDHEVNTFETTIRMLGGFLSAHYLSTNFPEMAPIAEDDYVKHGEDLYLEKAADLADRLLAAFDSSSGVPYASVNLKTLKGVISHDDDGASSTAEAGSLQLEFKYLAMLMGEKIYWEKAERVIQVIDDNGMEDGLLPIFIYADKGHFKGSNIRLGSRGDSYYEYLIKQYLQTSREEPIYSELWEQALAGIRKHLIMYTKHANLTILAERPDGLSKPASPKMDHLVCFMPGTIALAATGGLSVAEARKSKNWTQKQEGEIELAKELMKTCWGMYKVTATGLAPEITFFEVDDPALADPDGNLSSADINFQSPVHEGELDWQSDYIIKTQDAHNLQRPETVESLFYMWRITGDPTYRDWGWEMFSSFVEHTAVKDNGGFSSLQNANTIPAIAKDNMESFWLAETLKYFYLLFSPVDLLPLDSIVINTEAHIFPRFKLQRGLKTGWKRQPRDSHGNLLVPKKLPPPSQTSLAEPLPPQTQTLHDALPTTSAIQQKPRTKAQHPIQPEIRDYTQPDSHANEHSNGYAYATTGEPLDAADEARARAAAKADMDAMKAEAQALQNKGGDHGGGYAFVHTDENPDSKAEARARIAAEEAAERKRVSRAREAKERERVRKEEEGERKEVEMKVRVVGKGKDGDEKASGESKGTEGEKERKDKGTAFSS